MTRRTATCPPLVYGKGKEHDHRQFLRLHGIGTVAEKEEKYTRDSAICKDGAGISFEKAVQNQWLCDLDHLPVQAKQTFASQVPCTCHPLMLQMRNANQNLYYYCTKCGVDNANQMAWLYSVKSGARRRPVAVSDNIFNLVRINA